MRSLSVLIIGLLISASAFAADPRTEVEKVTAAYAESYDKQNAAGIIALYAQGGALVNAAGVHSAAELAEYYAKSFKSGYNHLESTVNDAFSIAPDVVVGRGEFTVTGQGAKGALQAHGRWTCVYLRENGVLKIRQLTAVPIPASN